MMTWQMAWVFHACAAEAVDNIIAGGFNRSYAGKNATVYGPGSYFARVHRAEPPKPAHCSPRHACYSSSLVCSSLRVWCEQQDASYSARRTYSPPDEHGLKRIFMCRLALGAHAAVNPGYSEKEPPVRDPNRLLGVGTLRYDTTTNDRYDEHGVAEIMVAYKDNQAYADYLVTFAMD